MLWIAQRLGITGAFLGYGTVDRTCHVGGSGDRGLMTMMTRAQLGSWGEQLAVDHLTGLGLCILTRNWRCRYGELDVVAADMATRTVVFVEVKTRTGDGFGGLAQAVTRDKVRRLRRLAGLWLMAQHHSWAAIRIDMIGVRIGRFCSPQITHVPGID